MAVENLTVLTVLFQFLPPLLVTFVYLLFFRKRKSKLIEVFILVMYLTTITWFLFNIGMNNPITLANPAVDTSGFSWVLLTDLIYQFAVSLQSFLTWILIAFYAVLFGMVVLGVKLLLQDPLKMRFSNVIRRITKREPESDGFRGFRDRVNNIRFEGVEPQPLDPEVQAKAWSSAWKDYVIIGLATLIPSISAYVGTLPQYIDQINHPEFYISHPELLPSNYYLGVFVFLTWIWRFGYPASNRIAKGAGLRLGDRDIGSEMMRGVLGWFFRLNILLTLYTIITQAFTALSSNVENIAAIVFEYYLKGLLLAFPPILFAVIVLPLVEDFAVVFYKRLFEALINAKAKIRSLNIRNSIVNSFSAVSVGFLISIAFIGAVIAATMNFTVGAALFPRQLGDSVKNAILNAPNLSMLLPPVVWTLMMLGIPFAFMLLIGILGHMVRKRLNAGIETFAFFSGFTLSMVTYYVLSGMDYILAYFTSSVNYAGETIYRLIPFPEPPKDIDFFWRIASQFVINLPMYIFTVLFILYFFEFREKWKETTGEIGGPLVNVHKQDIIESTLMFFGGLVVSLVGVLAITLTLQNPGWVLDLLQLLFAKIGDPDGLEAILIPKFPDGTGIPPLSRLDPGGWFVVIAEHNIIRTFLMLIIGPVFWSAILWFAGVKKQESEQKIGTWSVVLLILCGAITVVWTQFDAINNLFNRFDPLLGFTAQMGFRSIIVFGIPVLLIGLYVLFRYVSGKGIGGWWFPLFILLFAIEYFIYDDQFTLIALIVLPFFLAGGYRLIRGNRTIEQTGKQEDFIITFIKFSLMSLAIAEVLSTALILGGIAIIHLFWGGDAWWFIKTIIPHAVVEIPVFLLAAAAAIRISKDLWPTIEAENWEEVPAQTRGLLADERTWRTYALIAFFLIIAALIEAYVTPLVVLVF